MHGITKTLLLWTTLTFITLIDPLHHENVHKKQNTTLCIEIMSRLEKSWMFLSCQVPILVLIFF